MHLDDVCIVHKDQRIAQLVEIGAQGFGISQALAVGLVDEKLGAVGEFDILGIEGGKVDARRFPRARRGRICLLGRLAGLHRNPVDQQAGHTLEQAHIALPAGIHHAGFFQDRKHLRGPV